jgi:hypothetical protein
MHKVRETNNSRCTVMSSEWRRSGKKKDMMKLSLPSKLMVFWVSSPTQCYCTFLQLFFKSHPVYDQTLGSGAVFSYFPDNSNMSTSSKNQCK